MIALPESGQGLSMVAVACEVAACLHSIPARARWMCVLGLLLMLKTCRAADVAAALAPANEPRTSGNHDPALGSAAAVATARVRRWSAAAVLVVERRRCACQGPVLDCQLVFFPVKAGGLKEVVATDHQQGGERGPLRAVAVGTRGEQRRCRRRMRLAEVGQRGRGTGSDC